MIEPMPMEPPLAARIDQAAEDEGLEDIFDPNARQRTGARVLTSKSRHLPLARARTVIQGM